MFKQNNKTNENAIKKDFFAKKKKLKTIEYFEHHEQNKNPSFFSVVELKTVKSPKKEQVFFIRSKKARPITDLIPENATDIYIFASKIKEKFLSKKENEIKGLVLYHDTYDKNPVLVKKYNSVRSTNHSKIICFKKNNNSFVIFGSGNPAINARLELYICQQSEEIYKKIVKCFSDVQKNEKRS